jgi:FixJ family two-component response regulator
VLYWITEGKTNPEIAIILDVSSHSVKKRAPNLSAKLRGAASDLSGKLCALNPVAESLSARAIPRK